MQPPIDNADYILDDVDGILCDLDGCLVSDNQPLIGAVEFVRAYGEKMVLMSNNSTDSPRSLCRKLEAIGLNLPASRILLAGTYAVDLISQQCPGARIFIAGTDEISNHAVAQGLTIVTDTPEIVLLTRDEDFSYKKLQLIIGYLLGGASLWVANMDRSHPGLNGNPVPETGTLFAMIKSCLPDIEWQEVGKPEGFLYKKALELLDLAPKQTIAIGDNPDTDGEGAHRLGIRSIIVGGDARSSRSLVDLLPCANLPITF